MDVDQEPQHLPCEGCGYAEMEYMKMRFLDSSKKSHDVFHILLRLTAFVEILLRCVRVSNSRTIMESRLSFRNALRAKALSFLRWTYLTTWWLVRANYYIRGHTDAPHVPILDSSKTREPHGWTFRVWRGNTIWHITCNLIFRLAVLDVRKSRQKWGSRSLYLDLERSLRPQNWTVELHLLCTTRELWTT